MVRGPPTIKRTIQGIRDLVSIGLTPVVSTAITLNNAGHIADTTRMLGGLGVKEHHILWLQERGRAYDNNDLLIPPPKVTQIMRELRGVAADLGMVIDNETSLRVRVRGKHGRKTDLCNCGYESLDVFSDGQVYPCVWFSGAPSLACGSVRERALKDIWLNSPILQEIRANSVQRREGCNECHLKFICGGGTSCSSYFDSLATRGKGSFQAAEPYCETFMDLTHDLLWEQASQRVRTLPEGYHAPVIYNSMEGQGAACAKPNTTSLDSAFDVGSFHCACVLQADVADGMKVRSAARVAAMQAGDLPTPATMQTQTVDLFSAATIQNTGGKTRERNFIAVFNDDPGAGRGRRTADDGLSAPTHQPPTTPSSVLNTQSSVLNTQSSVLRPELQEKAVFDGMGQTAAQLLLTTAQRVRALEPGEILKVVSDDPATREDLGAWCRMTGNELTGVVKGKGYASYYVRRTQA
jgi:radical SAM protein with 4Fe4S-binding SPASM domain